MCVSLFHRVCVFDFCNQSLFTTFRTPYTSVTQLQCRTLHVGTRCLYSTSPPYTTVSFHGMSISLHAGLMMAAGREQVVEEALTSEAIR